MHIQCSGCGARYQIADEKIPIQGARVRCRRCSTIFAIAPPEAPPAPEEIPVIPPTPQSDEEPAAPAPFEVERGFGFERHPSFSESVVAAPPIREAAPVPEAPAISEAPRVHEAAPRVHEAAPMPAAAPAEARAAARVPQARAAAPAQEAEPPTGIPAGLSETERVRHERARRLARVLASDIAIYNKEKRDRGIKEGNLVAVLGYEIKKSWEVYKERVTADLANTTPYFRDALNEIVAEGKKIF